MQIIPIHLDSIELNAEELNSIQQTQDILRNMLTHYGRDLILTSPNTGEVVQLDELPRILGVLDFFLCNRVVKAQTAE